MLYIYRPTKSTGARALRDGILFEAGRINQQLHVMRTQGERLRHVVPNIDAVVCWGAHVALPANVRTLNNVPPISKFEEAERLRAANVATVQVSRTRPPAGAARPGVRPLFNLNTYRGLNELTPVLATRLQQELNAYILAPIPPAQPAEIWLPRRNSHRGGKDLLTENLPDPQFYSKKEHITEEYRLHMFKGKSIRAGKKVAQATRPDTRTAPHPWIRSYDAGWNIVYDRFESTKAMRKLAGDALEALGLDFAAVDMGLTGDGRLIVLECNRAPGIEGNSIHAYATAILKWLQGDPTPAVPPRPRVRV